MWTLECEGDSLKGKKIWLRPGKTYLFGRTKAENDGQPGFAIANRSVSRKHMTLMVSKVKPGDGSNIKARSVISIEDRNTKFGTLIDGDQFKGETRTLSKDEHTIMFGTCEEVFRIKWKPVVLSFSFPSSETKNGKDPLASIRGRLEDLDVKTIITYDTTHTTHVVSAKRNTAKSLQALINGVSVVDNNFLDAIFYAASPTNLDEPESLSPLEEDFDRAWPNEVDFLPPPGNEPHPRPAAMFAADPDRKHIFEGFSFIFGDKKQQSNLKPAITDGGGKVQFFHVEDGQTSSGDLVDFFIKISRESSRGASGHEVLFVHFPGGKTHREWAAALQSEVAKHVGYVAVEQNQFLDAILTKQPRSLIQSIDGQDSGDSDPAIKESPRKNTGVDPGIPEAKKTARRRPRGTVQSYFKGFDDGFDASQIQPSEPTISRGVSRMTPAEDVIMEEAEGEENPRKRPAPLSDELDDEEFLPAAAMMKRRKLQEEKEGRRWGSAANGTASDSRGSDAPGGTGKRKAKKKELDIQEAVKKRREEEEEQARQDEQELQATLSDLTVEQMKALAVVEEVDVPEREPVPSREDRRSERWDPKWDGRKNFKRFRRKGESATPRAQPVIVPLEEVKKKRAGGGDQYVVTTSRRSHRDSIDESARASRTERNAEAAEASEAGQSQDFVSAASHHEEEIPAELASAPGTEVSIIDVDAPRATRQRGGLQQQQQQQQRNARPAPKRQASQSTNATVSQKKQKRLAVSKDSDSEDELRFRFSKKG